VRDGREVLWSSRWKRLSAERDVERQKRGYEGRGRVIEEKM
jgi:hypothetical protein